MDKNKAFETLVTMLTTIIIVSIVLGVLSSLVYPTGYSNGYRDAYWDAFVDYKNNRLLHKIETKYKNKLEKYYGKLHQLESKKEE